MKSEKIKTIEYIFDISDKTRKSVLIELCPDTLDYINNSEMEEYPNWVLLDNYKCDVCLLKSEDCKYCPIAKNIYPIIEQFRKYISYQKVDLTIKTLEREFFQKSSIQVGLSSLFGVIMTTSGCPVLDKLRPMVYTHLPFATGDETIYRVLSMYMLAQYYRDKKGLTTDFKMKGLIDIYERINTVNSTFINRFREANSETDAHLNAIVKLSCFNYYVVPTIENDVMHNLEKIFDPYLMDE